MTPSLLSLLPAAAHNPAPVLLLLLLLLLLLQLTPLLGSQAGSGLTLPSGAMGILHVASDWSLGQPHTSPLCDMETWMVMELMDRGTLAAVVRAGGFVHPVTRTIKMVRRGVERGSKLYPPLAQCFDIFWYSCVIQWVGRMGFFVR
jgi:hypothetical protein